MIKIGEIKKQCMTYRGGASGEVNATEQFKKDLKASAEKLAEVLNNTELDAQELLNQIDQHAGVLLGYRWNIVDYSHYSEDENDAMCHKYLNSKDY